MALFPVAGGRESVAPLAIRRYEPGDEDAVWDLHERALRDVGAYDDEFAHLDADLRRVESEYLDGGGEFLVGTVDGEIVAMGAVQPSDAVEHHETDDGAGVLRRMRVDPDHQRRGFGSRILDALERRARELGFKRLVLDTTPRQAGAIALYEGAGYECVDTVTADDHEMLLYAKEL